MARTPILHVDMDAFYASVAVHDRPELRGLPVIVGGGSRGVVLSASYQARRSGVHSAMPMTRARRACPDAVVVSPQFDRYQQVSAAVMETFRTITPLVQACSFDEAYLDVSGAARRFGSPTDIAERLRARIHDEQGITCSVGVAATLPLAKMASTSAKPDGVRRVSPEEVIGFLHPLPVDALPGVGEKTAAQLQRLGLRRIGDLAHTPETTLCRALGPAVGTTVHRLAWGDGDRAVIPRTADDPAEHSMGADETFGRDTDDPAQVRRELLRLATKLARRLRAAEAAGRTVVLRVRFADFTTITRSRTLPDPTDVAPEIYAAATGLFAALRLQRARIRLVGIRVQGLLPADRATRQLELGAREHGWPEVERAADKAFSRFGASAVRPASLIR